MVFNADLLLKVIFPFSPIILIFFKLLLNAIKVTACVFF